MAKAETMFAPRRAYRIDDGLLIRFECRLYLQDCYIIQCMKWKF